jgi:hypothetical protein
MTEGFQIVLAASDEERRDLFVGAADRLRTNEQNIEKDFWVCWTLDALFNELEAGGPRLLFKGGTSLSKGYGLIERFSEDIDITVFREDIGQPATVEELEALSGKKRNARLEAIKAACQEYIQGPMLEQLSALLRQTLQTANLNADRARVEADRVTTTMFTVSSRRRQAERQRRMQTWPRTVFVMRGCFSTGPILIWPPPFPAASP